MRARLQDGSMVNIEVQLCNEGDFEKRSLFYWSREYNKGIGRGDDYIDLPAVICVNIIDFEFLETENFHTVFHLREGSEPRLVLTGVLEIHFVSMVKWRRRGDKDTANDPLHRWLAYLDKTSSPELVMEVINMDSAIKMANDRQAYVSADEDAIRIYEMREKARLDWNSSINHARREGIREGKIEIARNALAEGLPLEVVQKITGLDSQAIEKLK